MDREQRRKNSIETRFELNACMSVFKQSHVSFPVNNQQATDMLGGAIQEVAFSYNQDLSLAFETSAASGIPPVHELFGGFIGCYRYVDSSPTTQRGTGVVPALGTRPRSSNQAYEIPGLAPGAISKGKESNKSTLLHTNLARETKESELELDCKEAETMSDQCNEF